MTSGIQKHPEKKYRSANMIDFKNAIKIVYSDLFNFSGKPTLCSLLNETYALNDMDMTCNAQSFINISRKRLCKGCASEETREAWELVKKYAKQVTPLKKITPHKLRSTFGTNLYLETGDIYLVADVLGHSDVNTTRKHYADMTDSKRREAARHVKLPAPDDN
mgnify:CR=1 FL=1